MGGMTIGGGGSKGTLKKGGTSQDSLSQKENDAFPLKMSLAHAQGGGKTEGSTENYLCISRGGGEAAWVGGREGLLFIIKDSQPAEGGEGMMQGRVHMDSPVEKKKWYIAFSQKKRGKLLKCSGNG